MYVITDVSEESAASVSGTEVKGGASAVKMKATFSSRSVSSYEPARCASPDDLTLGSHHREVLRSHLG